MSFANRALLRRNMLSAALACVPITLAASLAQAGETPGAVTISISGSTAMSTFTIGQNFTALRPGGMVDLSNGFIYRAAPGLGTSVQLGEGTGAGDGTPPATGDITSGKYRAFRSEYHAQGSVEGILEMANDQVGTISSIVGADRNPTTANSIYVNGSANRFQSPLAVGATNSNGYGIATSNYNTYTNFTLGGSNLQGGQNRVQMAISDVTAAQGFSISAPTGMPTAVGAWNLTPGVVGYGKGNSRLAAQSNVSGTGTANARQQLSDQTVLDMPTSKVDPSTGANYAVGAWNNAGVNNLVNKAVAITATTYAANPGTGLTKINRTDAQFLQATGRLANGADFNVVTRDVNSGTRNVAALNVGLDPSFAVGENDGGNTGTVVAATDPQNSIGTAIRFTGKTSGGSALRPTVQNSRMAIGHLSIGDARGATAPLRVLSFRDDANDLADQAGDAAVDTFVKPSFDTVSNGTYALYQNETYVTVKTPDANYANGNIKGDYAKQDVRQFRDNILQSAATYNADGSSGFLSPANGLVAAGFIPPQYMQVSKQKDGIRQSVATGIDTTTASYSAVRSAALNAFSVADASSVTSGGTYGSITAANGGIAITANNFLFGDFDYDGDRDFADVKLAAAAQDKLAQTAAGVVYLTTSGSSNAQAVSGLTGALATMNGYDGTTGAKRGDLIVKGDYDSNGTFDGKDLYLLARGASLATSTSVDTLSGNFADSVRTGVLRKNAALKYLNDPTHSTAAQRGAASVDGVVGGSDDALAFDPRDVNRDGVLDRFDAQVVDHFIGKNVGSLEDQISATTAANGRIDGSMAKKSISLVDVELDDNLAITATLVSGVSDFQIIRDGLGSLLTYGDTNFDADVDFDDLVVLAQNYLQGKDQWSEADFDLDGTVTFDDLVSLAQNYGVGTGNLAAMQAAFPADWALAQSMTPEPGVMMLAASAAFATLGRRRPRQNSR